MVAPGHSGSTGTARGIRTVVAASAFVCLVPTMCAYAQNLPPSVAACAGETDVLKRLSCFDRAVAPFLAKPLEQAAPAVVAPAIAAPATAAAQAPVAVAPPTATPAQGAQPVQARIASIDTYPDGIVVHLDNGQVWREDDDTPVDLGLSVGDSVTIERQVGAYWLSGRNGTAAKVRLKN